MLSLTTQESETKFCLLWDWQKPQSFTPQHPMPKVQILLCYEITSNYFSQHPSLRWTSKLLAWSRFWDAPDSRVSAPRSRLNSLERPLAISSEMWRDQLVRVTSWHPHRVRTRSPKAEINLTRSHLTVQVNILMKMID